ncbi:MAG: hypothetical protein OEV00_12225, partial [Acidobacteriota bacterium]|nr:hypothetical protein [Acidobacteriota bacterium]
MKRLTVLTVLFVLATAGCAARYQNVRVPPRIDLSQHEIIAVVEFDSTNEGQLGPLATRRFTDLARRDQGLVRMMNVEANSDQRDTIAIKRLAQKHGAQTVLVGKIDVSDVRPNLSVSRTLKAGSLTANVDAILTV